MSSTSGNGDIELVESKQNRTLNPNRADKDIRARLRQIPAVLYLHKLRREPTLWGRYSPTKAMKQRVRCLCAALIDGFDQKEAKDQKKIWSWVLQRRNKYIRDASDFYFKGVHKENVKYFKFLLTRFINVPQHPLLPQSAMYATLACLESIKVYSEMLKYKFDSKKMIAYLIQDFDPYITTNIFEKQSTQPSISEDNAQDSNIMAENPEEPKDDYTEDALAMAASAEHKIIKSIVIPVPTSSNTFKYYTFEMVKYYD